MLGVLVRLTGVLGLLILASSSARTDVHFLAAPFGLLRADMSMTARSYPEALPNDGRSEATISVQLEHEGKPLAGAAVKAQVVAGDGMLTRSEAVTDDNGVAEFAYRAGTMPQDGIVSVKAEADVATAEVEVKVPLAAVSYLDLLLVPPDEYLKHLARQTAAAPIYRLEVEAFPKQLAADGGSLALVTATLTLVASGKPAAAVPLTAELLSGDGSISTSQLATDQTGRMSFQYISGRSPGAAVIQITEPSTGLCDAAQILLTEAGPARIQLLPDSTTALSTDHDGSMLPADGVTALPLTVQVTDLSGLPLRGVEVRIEILDYGAGRLEVLDSVSSALGEVRCVYHCGASAGKVRLRAFAADGLPD